jgi:hypothetical protein
MNWSHRNRQLARHYDWDKKFPSRCKNSTGVFEHQAAWLIALLSDGEVPSLRYHLLGVVGMPIRRIRSDLLRLRSERPARRMPHATGQRDELTTS